MTRSYLHYLHLSIRATHFRIAATLIAAAFVSIGCIGPVFVQALTQSISTITPPLVINEVETGGCSSIPCVEDTKQEFIELYNTQSTPLQVSGWDVQYISATGVTTTNLLHLTGKIDAHGYVLLAHVGYYSTADLFFGASATGSLAKSGGHIEILDSSKQSVDRLGWGTAAKAAVQPVAALLPGQSAERITDSSGATSYSGNNAVDFAVTNQPTPEGGGFTTIEDSIPIVIPPAGDPATEPPTGTVNPAPPTDSPITSPPITQDGITCEGVEISELLPNPASTDTGHEFIELHNTTTDIILLSGCSLQTSASTSKSFALSGSLEPGGYYAYYDSLTGLSLPNSAGGTVWLNTISNELQAVIYPADMADDMTWAQTDSGWEASFTSTPGAQNIATPSKPCDAGQVRNPDTNRCINATAAAEATSTTAKETSASASQACKEGQERNPATNRCRNIASASASAAGATVACKTGQERNPETNRCRNIVVAAEAKPCPTGQERNSETNRCRKVTAAGSSNGSTLDGVKDVSSSPHAKPKPYWLIAAAAIAAALCYGVYEWRQEIVIFFRKSLNKLNGTQNPSLNQL